MKRRIKFDHVAKIEGHASLITDLESGEINRARFKTLEGSRFIEGILVGRNYQEAPLITARICGVCPVVHNLGSILAIEDALKVKVSEKTVVLRKLMMWGQFIQSHSLHLYFLTLPDYFKMKNSLKLLKDFPKETKQALEIRAFGNKLIEVIGGRSIHPMNSAVGGFMKTPNERELKELLKQIEPLLKIGAKITGIFNSLNYPKFSRKTEFVSLTHEKEYPIYQGTLTSTIEKGITKEKFIKEVEEEYSNWQKIKKTKLYNKIYMVGSLARLNINRKLLNPKAKALLKESGIEFPSFNTFHNILGQMIEIVNGLEESKTLIKKYLEMKGSSAVKKYQIKAGTGIGAIEAPRGTLFHVYEIDKLGYLKNVNIITPTAQFVNNLEEDIKAFLPNINDVSSEESKRKIKMLVRAYDPCMTCATH
ncbi:Ni/Fe hydrogenase subunit alpha [Patescibacteria group bacterium]|nr:Ni/Fe hydrogenase subunit alpha [Patescibacteria group bacterium]MBU1074920.1 Ni/Fe hydrogenase subunit alpha [Patescibacteria group bacterium]MBU1952469.1 Ni/Fe hydrogenase subunit alpha [Patescibacteria group bacterium]